MRRAPARPWMLLLCAKAAAAAAAQPAPDVARPPVTLQADRLSSTPDGRSSAEGEVELRQGGLRIRADRIDFRADTERASARGAVVVEGDGLLLRSSEIDLGVRDFSGWCLAPEFDFLDRGTRGSASRIDFASRTRLRADNVAYTSCPPPARPGGRPDWELRARSVAIDFDANEGVAEGARLHFQGVTLLALPKLSFPVTDARKSGWLPPTVGLDSRSGFEVSVPYYWNLAPNRDLTLAPRVSTRRGLGLEAEYRYLEPRWRGEISLDGLPDDRVAGRSRHALTWQHRQRTGRETALELDLARVSDDDWWKDFPRATPGPWPRLLASSARIERPWQWRGWQGRAWTQLQDWQLLQDPQAPIVAPYARRPQLGVLAEASQGPLQWRLTSEINRFERPADDIDDLRQEGWRWHALADLAWPLRRPGGWLVPRLALHGAWYRTDDPMADGRTTASRWIPSASLDAALVFERDASWFGRALRQTLEPRALYVRTAYQRQDRLPNFDAWARDFDFDSVWARNAFAGVDRISDADQLTLGATSRLIDPASGGELLRLGAVQRVLLRDQRVAPKPDGSADGVPLERSVSDLLLLGSTTLVPGWTLDASMQYSPDQGRLARSVLGAHWSPGPFRTVDARYRLARGTSEQIELGWQWPLGAAAAAAARAAGEEQAAAASAARPMPAQRDCAGRWVGVGRIAYSMRDRSITDSLLGLEYDAGCWIARVVAERVSTGVSEATTRLMLQLELVGLSRLGTDPLRVLKDNIPGYRLLRDERGEEPSAWPSTLP